MASDKTWQKHDLGEELGYVAFVCLGENCSTNDKPLWADFIIAERIEVGGEVLCERKRAVTIHDSPVPGPENVEVFAEGSVKWDGCVNTDFSKASSMHHGCERAHLTRIGEVLGRAYDLCAEALKACGSWDGG